MIEFLVSLAKIAEGLHGLKMLVDTARANPQGTIALLILVLAGAVVALILRRTRRGDSLSIR